MYHTAKSGRKRKKRRLMKLCFLFVLLWAAALGLLTFSWSVPPIQEAEVTLVFRGERQQLPAAGETAGELLDRLAVLGAALLSKTLSRFAAVEDIARTHQDESQVSYAPMLDKSMCPIDWSKTAQQIHNQVRGLHPWPVATMELNGTLFKVHETRVVPGSGEPGAVLELNKNGLVIACGQGAVEIRALQAEGGKRMAAPDYFRGHPLKS